VPTRAEDTRQQMSTADDPARPPGRLRTLLRREQGEEDGVFRPVRLPLWIDLAISAAIVVLVVGGFVGFVYFLARTQGR
jgi:uncharacterized ion transporter superfamily protein YfcC